LPGRAEEEDEAEERERNRHTARHLLGEPLLGDYLADGLAAFGLSWVDDDGAAPE
jgi:hypothetical protein